jgi:hypothetical protein
LISLVFIPLPKQTGIVRHMFNFPCAGSPLG